MSSTSATKWAYVKDAMNAAGGAVPRLALGLQRRSR